MCGDFNAHNTLWSHNKTDKRGEALEKFMFRNDLVILNSTIKTHINRKTHGLSLLDLSIVHPALYLDFESEVLHDPHGSDHYPIIVTVNGTLFETDKRPRWNFKKADWNSFRRQCRTDLIADIFEPNEDEVTVFTENY